MFGRVDKQDAMNVDCERFVLHLIYTSSSPVITSAHVAPVAVTSESTWLCSVSFFSRGLPLVEKGVLEKAALDEWPGRDDADDGPCCGSSRRCAASRIARHKVEIGLVLATWLHAQCQTRQSPTADTE
jgi:hypothetical protein